LRTPISGAQFRRDVKLAQKRGKDMDRLREVILRLVEGKPLPARYKDHPLGGEWSHHRDCHIRMGAGRRRACRWQRQQLVESGGTG
jgi:mRNA interferase YafQ